jgi:hypothetical protein
MPLKSNQKGALAMDRQFTVSEPDDLHQPEGLALHEAMIGTT